MIDEDAIVNEAVAGETIRTIARRHACSTADVRRVLDGHASEMLKPAARAQMLALELSRLEQLEAVFLRHAIETLDPASGTLVCKISQRRAALCGLDQPAEVRLDIQAVAQPDEETTTRKMLRAVRALRGEPDPSEGEQGPPDTLN